MADLSNGQFRGYQVVAVHLHSYAHCVKKKNVDYLPCEYRAGVTEDSHELEVGFGERQSSSLHWSTTDRLKPSFLEFWRLHLLKDASFARVSAEL